MIKLTIQGTPEDLIKLRAVLSGAGVDFVYSSDMSKRSATATWASQKLGVNLPDVPANVLQHYQPTQPVKIFERRRKLGKGQPQSKQGFVYLMPAHPEGYKIGRTTNVNSRRRTFSTKYPFPVEFIAVIETDDCHALEKQLHQQFASKRMGRSEFFKLSAEDVAYIQSLVKQSRK